MRADRAALHSRSHFNLTEECIEQALLLPASRRKGEARQKNAELNLLQSAPRVHSPSIYSAFYCTRHFGKNAELRIFSVWCSEPKLLHDPSSFPQRRHP